MTKGNYFRFLNWQVYQDAKKFSNLSFQVVKNLPREYRFEVGSQIIRSSMSVPLNIAEGSGKNSDKDFNHFLNIALGSLFETIASFDILRDNKLITEKEFEIFVDFGNKISSQLGGFKKKLVKS
ncbi:MAG: four helix bundle protein [Patescibacteria group bacterium]